MLCLAFLPWSFQFVMLPLVLLVLPALSESDSTSWTDADPNIA
jgi:hypothetical protein